MIRRKEACKTECREKMRGGEGSAMVTSLIAGPEELNDRESMRLPMRFSGPNRSSAPPACWTRKCP